jgi:hypothetical protein
LYGGIANFMSGGTNEGGDAGSEARIPALLKKVEPFGSAGFLSFLKKRPACFAWPSGQPYHHSGGS